MSNFSLAIRGILSRYSHVNWALADQAMVSGVNFLTGILFARYLGLEEYGRFTLAWMAVLFLNSFQQAGIIAPMMSLGPKQKAEDEPAYYGAVVVQQVIWSVVCFFLLWGGVCLSGYVKPEWDIQHLALPLAAALLAWQLQDFLRRYYFVRGQGGLAFLNDAISYLGQLALLVVLFKWTTLDTALVLWLIAGTSALAVGVGGVRLRGLAVPCGLLAEVTGRHWRFSKWLVASALMQWTSGNFFLVIAGGLLGPVAVGAVRAAQNIIGVTHILFQAMENFVPSGAARAWAKGGRGALVTYLKKVNTMGLLATTGIAGIAWAFAEFWLQLLYGTDFVTYSFVLRWFCIVYVFGFLAMPLTAGLRAMEKTRSLFVSMLIMSFFSLLCSWPLVAWLGLHGVMIGMLVVKVGTSLLLYRDFKVAN